MAGHSEERPKETTSYRSPWRVLARAFEKSRDLWKAKYKTLQERLKAFRTEVRDLRRSRDRWRAKAEALEQETNRLRARLQQQVERSPRAEPAVTTGPDSAFELIPPRHQFGLVQVLLMLGWVLTGMSLRGTCSTLDWMHEMDVEWGFNFPVSPLTLMSPRATNQRFGGSPGRSTCPGRGTETNKSPLLSMQGIW